MPISDRLALDPLSGRRTALERLMARVSDLESQVSAQSRSAPHALVQVPATTVAANNAGTTIATVSFLVPDTTVLKVFSRMKVTAPAASASVPQQVTLDLELNGVAQHIISWTSTLSAGSFTDRIFDSMPLPNSGPGVTAPTYTSVDDKTPGSPLYIVVQPGALTANWVVRTNALGTMQYNSFLGWAALETSGVGGASATTSTDTVSGGD